MALRRSDHRPPSCPAKTAVTALGLLLVGRSTCLPWQSYLTTTPALYKLWLLQERGPARDDTHIAELAIASSSVLALGLCR